MAAPPVPSSSNNLPKGWTFRVIHSQTPELTLETWAPEIDLSSHLLPLYNYRGLIGLSNQVDNWVRIQNGMTGAASCGPVHWAAFILAGLCLQSGWEYEGPNIGWGSFCQQGVSHIPSVPPMLVKAITGVGHPWPCCPTPGT